MSRRLRRSMSASPQQRAAWTRVKDPINQGIRTNTPDGWLGNPAFWVGGGWNGEDPRDACEPLAWTGTDGYGWIGPGSWAGLPGPYDGYEYRRMQAAVLPAVERATNVIVNPIIRADWQMIVSRGLGQHEEVPLPSWITDPMLLGSHPGTVEANTHYMERLSATDFWATFLTHSLWYGKGAFICQINERDQPIAGTMRLVNPFLIGYREGEWLVGDPNDPVRVPFDGVFGVGKQRFKLVVMRGLSPNDGILPEGILQRHWETLGIGVQIRTYIKDAYRFGNQPSGFLTVSTPNFDEHDARALREQWNKAHGGSKRSVAVLNSTVAYSALQTVSPVDAEAKEMAVANVRDIALMFNLDPVYLGTGVSGLNYQNQNDRRADLVDLNLSMWGQKLTDSLSAVLPYGTRVKINWPSFILPLQPQDPGAENYLPNSTSASPGDPEG